MKYWGALCTLLLFSLTACDAGTMEEQAPDTQCPPEPPADAADYFPLAVGQVWNFDYTMGRLSSGGSEREIGTVRWGITEERPCSGGKQDFTLTETFEGKEQVDPPGPGSWQDVLSFTRTRHYTITMGESLDLGPYSFDPVRRYYPPATEGTITFRQDNNRRDDALCDTGSSGGPCFIRLTLVRGEGLIQWGFHNEISVNTYDSGDLARVD